MPLLFNLHFQLTTSHQFLQNSNFLSLTVLFQPFNLKCADCKSQCKEEQPVSLRWIPSHFLISNSRNENKPWNDSLVDIHVACCVVIPAANLEPCHCSPRITTTLSNRLPKICVLRRRQTQTESRQTSLYDGGEHWLPDKKLQTRVVE